MKDILEISLKNVTYANIIFDETSGLHHTNDSPDIQLGTLEADLFEHHIEA